MARSHHENLLDAPAMKSKYPYPLIAIGLLAAGILWLNHASREIAPDLAPFFPTPMNVVHRMLELVEAGSEDVVYDLGCGDGRIVVTAAERFGARGVGVEYDPRIAQLAIDNVDRRNLGHLVEIVTGDATRIDVSEATVVTLYLLPDTIVRVRPNLERSLRDGARVATYNAEMPGWKPLRVEDVDDPTGRKHTLYLYEIGQHR